MQLKSTAFFASSAVADVLTASSAPAASPASAACCNCDGLSEGVPPAGSLSSVAMLRSLLYLLFGETVHRRRRDAEHRAIEIELPAMMTLVLDHGPQPLPPAQLRAARRHPLAIEVASADPGEDRIGP